MKEYKGTPFQGIKETANTTGFSQFYLRKEIKAGKIPHIKVGTKYLVNVPAFLEMMDAKSKKKREV